MTLPRRSKHHGTHPGKRVCVRLTSGETFVDVFLSGHSRHIELERRGRVLRSTIEMFAIYKPKHP